MKMYFFDVTVKVMKRGVPEKVVIYKGARGFQVVRIDRVPERCVEADAEGHHGRPGEEN